MMKKINFIKLQIEREIMNEKITDKQLAVIVDWFNSTYNKPPERGVLSDEGAEFLLNLMSGETDRRDLVINLNIDDASCGTRYGYTSIPIVWDKRKLDEESKPFNPHSPDCELRKE